MFIPPKNFQQSKENEPKSYSKIRLQSSHIIIEREIAESAFGPEKNVFMVYYAERRQLMIASITDTIFKSLHKASQHILKEKNLKGDKSIALHEILIDHQIDVADRDLSYDWNTALGIINVQL